MSKPMNVLIGYDGSPCGDAALDDLRWAGLPEDTSVTVLTVADVMGPPIGDEQIVPNRATEDWYPVGMEAARAISTELVEHAATLAYSACVRLQAEHPTWQVLDDVCAGSPSACILRKAEMRQADLIVLGSHCRSAVGRLILGSVSQAVVTQAHMSVRVVRARRTRPDQPLAIVIGFDGSAPSELVSNIVAKRAWPPGTRIHLVTALDPMLVTALASTAPAAAIQPGMFPDPTTSIRHRLEAEVDAIRGTIPSADVSYLLEEGDPKHILLQEAERLDAGCIFVGARGRTRWQRLLLGSVSAAVTARAHCSVEVVRPHPAAASG